jgi:hypothetical protein
MTALDGPSEQEWERAQRRCAVTKVWLVHVASNRMNINPDQTRQHASLNEAPRTRERPSITLVAEQAEQWDEVRLRVADCHAGSEIRSSDVVSARRRCDWGSVYRSCGEK